MTGLSGLAFDPGTLAAFRIILPYKQLGRVILSLRIAVDDRRIGLVNQSPNLSLHLDGPSVWPEGSKDKGNLFYLLQAVFSTTVIPSCIPGESGDNCTALVQTEDNPRVAQVSITKCSADMNGYCLHGQCIYLVDMSENYCRCEVGYTGVRCEHFFLTVQKPLSKEYVALTVILVILFLVIVAGSIYYFCRWYRNRKSKEPKKEYERVTSGDPALPQV
ncbi:proepiregulin [Budorcas taxicolor]|uniref:proepiregulin n=1 Tax=Budorcas taxicolor TaxID=37181 RepID=UPI0022849314|nr:proepiregulin [Budorcas taxicolor]